MYNHSVHTLQVRVKIRRMHSCGTYAKTPSKALDLKATDLKAPMSSKALDLKAPMSSKAMDRKAPMRSTKQTAKQSPIEKICRRPQSDKMDMRCLIVPSNIQNQKLHWKLRTLPHIRCVCDLRWCFGPLCYTSLSDVKDGVLRSGTQVESKRCLCYSIYECLRYTLPNSYTPYQTSGHTSITYRSP